MNMRGRWIQVPVMQELNMVNIWEHTPLDYYRYGEYPRFIRPPRAGDHKWRWEWVTSEQAREVE